jgi:predicted GNAT family acetyltransferase
VRLEGLLGGAQVVQRSAQTNGQVRDNLIVLSTKRRKRGERFVHKVSQPAEGASVTRREPQHLIAEPIRADKLEAEPADSGEQLRQLGKLMRTYELRRYERVEHCDVSRDTEWGIVIEAFPEPGYGGFGLGYLNDQGAWRARAFHGARQ